MKIKINILFFVVQIKFYNLDNNNFLYLFKNMIK